MASWYPIKWTEFSGMMQFFLLSYIVAIFKTFIFLLQGWFIKYGPLPRKNNLGLNGSCLMV